MGLAGWDSSQSAEEAGACPLQRPGEPGGWSPADWKPARIIPIYKEGMREDPGAYSPVSLSSVPRKNKMERITLGTIRGV